MADGINQADGSEPAAGPGDLPAGEEETRLIPFDVLEQLIALDASFAALEQNGQISVELHYHQGKRRKAWVRCGAVYDVKEA